MAALLVSARLISNTTRLRWRNRLEELRTKYGRSLELEPAAEWLDLMPEPLRCSAEQMVDSDRGSLGYSSEPVAVTPSSQTISGAPQGRSALNDLEL